MYKFFCFAVFVSGTFDHECFAWSTRKSEIIQEAEVYEIPKNN